MMYNYHSRGPGNSWSEKERFCVGDAPPLIDQGSNSSTKSGVFKSWLLSLFVLLFASSGFSQIATIGSGTTNTDGTGSDPIDGYFQTFHYQVVYTATELSAAGLSAGSTITALGFSISQDYAGATNLIGYTVKLGSTTATNSAAHDASPTTTVKNAFVYNPTPTVAGAFDMITFDTPYVYTGGNLLVDICSSGANAYTSPYGGVRTIASSTTNGSRVVRADTSTSQCGINTSSTNSNKPQISFAYTASSACSGTPSPGNTVASASSTCPGTTVNLSLQNSTVGSGVSYQWQSSSSLGGTYSNISGATFSGYTATINADAYFRALVTCSGNTGTSSPVGVTLNSYLTCYPVAYANNTADEEISNVTIGSLNNNSTCATTGGTGSVLNRYSDYTALTPVDLGRTTSVPFSLTQTSCGTFAYSNAFSVYIDFNQNGSFADSGERVVNQTAASALTLTYTGTFTIPAGAALGLTRMRVINVEFPDTAINYAQNAYGYGETEDYMVNITIPPTCITPTALTATSTISTANINWTASTSAPADGYDYEIRTSGAAGSGTTGLAQSGNVAAGVTTVSVTGLAESTTFIAYVRARCSSSDQSSWMSVSFNTNCNAPTAVTGTPSGSNATINWTAPANAPALGYDWEVRSAGAAGSGTTGLAASGSTAAGITTASATGLSSATTYTVYVRSHCSAASSSSWSSGTFTTVLINNNFANAIPVSCGNTYTGNTTTATSDQSNPAIFGVAASTTGTRNVWHSFTGTGTPQSVTLSLCTSEYDTAMLVGTGTAGNISWIAGNDDASETVCGLNNGLRSQVNFNSDGVTTYWIMVRGYGDGSYGAYNLVVTCAALCTPAAANDVCSSATPVTIGSPLATNNTCATAGSEAYPNCGNQFNSYFDTWYSFNSGNYTTLEFSAIPTTTALVGYAVYSGTCGTLAQVGCSTTGAAQNVVLTANTPYLVRVFSTTLAQRGDLTLGVKVPCLVPTAFAASNVSYFTADLGWTASVSAPTGGYEYELRTSGAAGSGATGLVSSGTIPTGTSVALSGLAYSTAYTGYVRSICGAGDNSPWASTTFTTLTPPTITVSSFNPTSVCDYERTTTIVTLSGSGFNGATSVTLGVESLAYTVVNDNTITVSLTSTSTNGAFAVQNSIYTTFGESSTAFVVKVAPVVEPIAGPSTVCAGSNITLTTQSSAGAWSTSDSGIATVTGGFVTGVSAGTATISYTIIENGCTTTQSHQVTVSPAVASSDPINASVLLGTEATFSVTASHAGTFQWQVSSDNDTFADLAPDAIYSNVSGDVPADGVVTLTIAEATIDLDGLFYRVILSGISPCQQYVSAGAVLNIGDTGISSFTATPASLCSTGSGSTSFTVATQGDVDYYIYYVNKNLGDGPEYINAAADGLTYDTSVPGTLSVTGITSINNGWIFYIEVGSNESEGSVFANATLTVSNAVAIATAGQPANQPACGNTAGSKTFSVAATGSALTYLWEYSSNGTTYTSLATSPPIGVTYSGSTTATLTVNYTAATPTGNYYYRAVVSGASACAPVTSSEAQLQLSSPTITAQPSPTTVSKGGQPVTFTVATSASSPSYQWQYADAVGGPYTNVVNATPTGITYSGATSATLTVTAGATAVGSNQRFYKAVITSGGCSATSSAAQLTVLAYCTPAPTSVDGSGITNVTIGTINNTTGAESGNYGNYTNLSTNLLKGMTSNFSITLTTGYTYGTNIWIDFNKDGDFEDSGEQVYFALSSGASPTTLSGSFTVANSAPVGVTRMRIGGTDNDLGGIPCYADSYGSYEDYSVNIIAPPACSGTPVAGTATASTSSICVSGTATLTATGYTTGVTGVSIQWYDTATGAITGATNPTYTTPVLTAAASYFFRVTCSNGSAFADTNTVTITVDNPSVASTTPATRCGIGTVALSATGSANTTPNWYSAATGGSLLYTGSTFTTPTLSASTTYYVSSGASFTALPTMTYCASTSTSTTYFITGVSTTGGGMNITNTGTAQSASGYGNFTSQTVRQTAGSAVNFSVNLSTPSFQSYGVNIWVDWNNDGDFLDAGENVYASNAYVTSATGSFTVPAGTAAGNHRMRVKADYLTTNPPPCGTSAYSETEDYTFAVSPCESARIAVTATVNTPPALALSASSASVCAGSSTTVTVTSNASDYDTYVWSPSTGVTGSATTGFTFSPSATTAYTLTAGNAAGCANTATFSVTVNAIPTGTVTPATATACTNGDATALTANFGATTSASFGTDIQSTGTGQVIVPVTVPVLPAGAVVTSAQLQFTNVSAINSSYRSEIRVATSGAYTLSPTALSTDASVGLISPNPSVPLPGFSATSGTVNLILTETYDDSGTDATFGTATLVINYSLPAVWSPVTGLFTDISGISPYSGSAVVTVYARPSATTVYTASVTSSAGCPASAQTTVTPVQATAWYVDADNDNYGDSSQPTVLACTEPANTAAVAGDCNDSIAAINPGASEILYNGIDENCNNILDEGNQLLSNVITQQCGITLAAINSVIQVTTYPNITQYRYRVYKIVSGSPVGAPQFVERAQPYFTLTQMSSYEYAATYSIQVELQRNGTWLGYYGSACQVSTPALLDNPNGSGSINPSLCGQTLATISTLIATPSLQSATAYKFRVTNITDPLAPGQVQEIERSQNYFALTMLPYYFYGTTYNVEVSVKASGVFSGYGATCPVTSPSVPMINNCDQHMAQPVNYISTASLNKVTSYRFEVSLVDANDNPVSSTTVDRTLPYFSFNMVPNYVQGGKYMVRVALRTTGYHSPFGEACFVYAPVSLRQDGTMKPEVLASRFDATVFPNPYVESFSLDFDSTSEDKVQLRVYDMIGKLLEERTFETTQIELAQFGQKYPSGVYNIVLTQGGNVKTLRVIKR